MTRGRRGGRERERDRDRDRDRERVAVPVGGDREREREREDGGGGRRDRGDVGVSAADRVKRNEWDADAWMQLVLEVQREGVGPARTVFETFLARFPTAGRFWKLFAELEIDAGNPEAAREIFGRCLLECPHVELWKRYLSFVGSTHDMRDPAARAQVVQAYEFCLQRLGQDIASGPVWGEYLSLLRRAHAEAAENQYIENQAMQACRKAYHAALQVPLNGLDGLWREYEEFEQRLNPVLARKLMHEIQPKYNAARAVFRKRRFYRDNLLLNAPAVPPSPTNYAEDPQVLYWKMCLDFERGNPQRVDVATLRKRVTLSFDQALCHLRFHPEVWLEYAAWLRDLGDQAAAGEVLAKARKVLPKNVLVAFYSADFEEGSRKDPEAAVAVFEALLKTLEADFAAAPAAAADEAAPKDKSRGAEAGSAPANKPPLAGGAAAEEPYVASDAELVLALAYIQYMRFLRRRGDKEGTRGSRDVFRRARQSRAGRCFQIYAASALMEYHSEHDATIAQKIFELGLKLPAIGGDVRYLALYATFLRYQNDTNNARVLFERALANLAPRTSGVGDEGEIAGPTRERLIEVSKAWSLFHSFETQFGSLASVETVETRWSRSAHVNRQLVLGAEDDEVPGRVFLPGIIRRYGFLGLFPGDAAGGTAMSRKALGLSPEYSLASGPNMFDVADGRDPMDARGRARLREASAAKGPKGAGLLAGDRGVLTRPDRAALIPLNPDAKIGPLADATAAGKGHGPRPKNPLYAALPPVVAEFARSLPLVADGVLALPSVAIVDQVTKALQAEEVKAEPEGAKDVAVKKEAGESSGARSSKRPAESAGMGPATVSQQPAVAGERPGTDLYRDRLSKKAKK